MFHKNCVFINLLLMAIFKIVLFLFLSFSSLWANSEFDILFRAYNLKLGATESDFLKNNFNITKSQTLIVQKQILVLPDEMKMYSISKGNTSKNLQGKVSSLKANTSKKLQGKISSLDQMMTDIVVYFYQDRLAIISTVYENFSSIEQIISIMNKNFGKPSYHKKFLLESMQGNTVYKWEKSSVTSLLDYTLGLEKAAFFVFDNRVQREIKEKINPARVVEKIKIKTVIKEKKITEKQCKKYYGLVNKYDKRNQKYKSRIDRYKKKEKKFRRASKKTKSQEKKKLYSDKAKRYKKRVKRYEKRITKYEKRIIKYKKRLRDCKI